MKTLNDIQTMIQTEGAPAYRAYRDSLKAARDTLESIHAEHYTTNDTPAQTVEKYISAVGYDLAAVVIASMVNRSAWDGRIDDRSKAWAASIEDALDRDAANRVELWSNKIHMVHLDQIARAFAKTERPTDPTPTDPTPDGTTDPDHDETNEATGSGSTWTPAPGDVVKISGGYFANSNGLFFIAHPSGSDWWLEPITKAGKIRKTGAQFWPLKSYCSDRLKNAAARKHNAEHAKIELVTGVPTCYIAEYYRAKAAELSTAADEQERRGYSYAADTRRSADEWKSYAERFQADDVPPEAPAPAPIRIYWNGIKVNGGDLVKCYYGIDDDGLTIHARDYKDLPREFFKVVNNSDGMTDYFEQDHAEVLSDHPLYKFLRFAALKGIATGHSYRKMTEAQAAEWASMKDPGQPTAEDAEAARAYLAAKAEEAKKAEEEKAAAEREAEAKRFEHQKGQADFIRQTAEAHPIEEGAPVVTVLWSEHPAFYEWNDTETLKLSVSAADIILKAFDDEISTAKANGGDEFGPTVWGYYKTKYRIDYTLKGNPDSFTDRYDIGDNNGGLVALISRYNGEDHPFTQLLREWSGGRIVSISVAPWVMAAQQEAQREAEKTKNEVYSLVAMLTDEQIQYAVDRIDRDDPHAEDIARFYIQELYRRDERKALETWKRWQAGETA